MHFNAVLSLVGIDLHEISLTEFLESLEFGPVDIPVDFLDRLKGGGVSS
jgi:hypothetical protein